MARKALYGPKYKEEACRMVLGQGYSAGEAARQLGIPKTTLLSWLKAHKLSEGPQTPAGPEDPSVLRARIRELEKQLEREKTEKEILKKAAAYFAREHA
jgi:transposase